MARVGSWPCAAAPRSRTSGSPRTVDFQNRFTGIVTLPWSYRVCYLMLLIRTLTLRYSRFDVLEVPPGLMVRSRDLIPTKIPQPRARRLEAWGCPILRDGRYESIVSVAAFVLAPPLGWGGPNTS